MINLLINTGLSKKLLSEWHPTKNGHLNPKDITYGSYEYIWWECSEGHVWGSTPSDRLKVEDELCPKCMKKKQQLDKLNNVNKIEAKSLREIDPSLSKQWNFERNVDVTPDNEMIDEENWSVRWWICGRGHEWKESVRSRLHDKTVCPYCSNKKVCKDNSLATMYPEIAKEFCIFATCYRQKVRNPYEAIYTSNEEVMWVCNEGHMWREKINLRVKNGKGCRTCEKYQQSIALHNPEIAKEWHPTKNKEVYSVTTPEETSTRCNERAWWVCGKCGHEYKAMVKDRHEGAAKCPSCYPPEPRVRKKKREALFQTYNKMEDNRVIFEKNLRGKFKDSEG
ncbi:zinc-ribbon domain-containing protein [Bacillus mycoides]|uniref:zinc-ribbon domain-containing protein n=1 Tax=Bacillus mycoides TaxID=1405 RepID=UPI002E0277C8|nr:zinc-ribbon domain-containing protein [Bacillus mycoides]MEC5267075.1 zinc-ribbon domain-containing protein [Bacillus mycoides]